ncbi:MAG: HEPN domain-containing protein [Candidatus Omnitrophica bacterium]|nr:HEPN domain-containing protein [Candidatus Omnitrophota bacterium]
MKEDTRKLLEKAERALQTANSLLHSNDMEFIAGRAYYAMFYVAEALLNEKDLTFGKHSGVHSAFGQHFI